MNGTNGTQSFLLTGGDLGFKVQAYNHFVLGNDFLLGNSSTIPVGNSPLYYGPGNGVDQILESETVPIDAGTASHLYVETANRSRTPVRIYKFTLCINSNCNTGVTCTINLPTATECNDLVDTQAYNAGDDIALRGDADVLARRPTNVKWSVVYTLTTPPPTPTPTPTPSPMTAH